MDDGVDDELLMRGIFVEWLAWDSARDGQLS